MTYYLDYNGTSTIVPNALQQITTVRYVKVNIFTHPDIKNLYMYFAWIAYLRNEFDHLQFLTTPAFYEWMFSPYTSEEYDYASVTPPIPRIVLVSALFFNNVSKLDLLHTPQGRAHLLLEFFFRFSSLFPGERWPAHLMPLFAPTEEEKLPLMLSAYRENNESLKADYPCRNDDEKALYLAWAVSEAKQIFPDGVPPASLVTWLDGACSRNTGEGISRAFAGISTHPDWKKLSISSPLSRLQFAAALLMYRPLTPICPWQWEELCSPYAADIPIPKHAVGLAIHLGIKKDHIINSRYRRKILGLYLLHALPHLKRFGLPDWLKPFLFRPADNILDAKKYGISELMACLAAGSVGPQLQKGQEKEFVRWYLCNDLDLPEDMFAASWQVHLWTHMHELNVHGISNFSHVFFAARFSDTVSLLGWSNVVSGVGEDCRSMLETLKGQAIKTSLLDISSFAPPSGDISEAPLAAPEGFVNVICLAAQDIYRLQANTPPEWWAGRYNIGICPWELPEWPKSALFALDKLDKIWAPSTFVAQAFAACGKPVAYVPHTVRPLKVTGNLRRELSIGADTKVFLTCYDSNASYARKNPLAVIHAFNRAFPSGDSDVCLIVKTMNAEKHLSAWQELHEANNHSGNVIFLNERFSSEWQALLLNTCDAFISLHRSEGFGRLLAEAMSLGKLLIASNFGGNTDFTTAETACPVNGKLIDVTSGEYLFGEGQQWFNADVEHAAHYIKDFAANPNKYLPLAAKGRRHILEQHSPEAVGQIVRKELAEIIGSLG
ncbi:Glycosyl transferases group 1 [anaerobic digester metagenome]